MHRSTASLLLALLISPFVLPAFAAGGGGTDIGAAPRVRWSCATNAPLYGSPVVHGGTVFIGGLDSLLRALDLSTGAERWRYRTGGGIRSSVCLGEGRLYLNGGDGVLYALDAATGAELWRFATKGERMHDFADYFHSTPVLEQGALYFGSGDGRVYAVDAGTGAMRWSFATGGVVHATPALSGGTLFIGSFDGHVYALRIGDGALVWKFKTVGHRYFPAGEVQGSPAVFKNLVIVGARDYNVYALDQEKGYCRWNKAFSRGWGLAMSVHDSVLYIGSSDERVMIAADPATGAESWNVPMEFLVFGGNAFSDSMLYVGTTNGRLHGMRRRSGEKVWSFATESHTKHRLKYFKGDGSYRDDIYSIILSNEQFLEVECELGGIFSTPVLAGEDILVSSTNGTLYCLAR